MKEGRNVNESSCKVLAIHFLRTRYSDSECQHTDKPALLFGLMQQ